MKNLAGKTILVTGAARRIGRAIAEELWAAGARVVLHHAHSDTEAASLAAKLSGSTVIKADLGEPDAAREVVQAAQDAGAGRLDGLVNNAASFQRTPMADGTLTDRVWEETLALNLTAPMRLIREAVRAGCTSIVNIVDVGAWQPWPNYAAYSTSKAALLHLTRCLALELAPTVRLNAVAPGTAIYPEGWSAEKRALQTARIPLGRPGEPADIARAVTYLMSEPYLTGVCLPVDGGSSLR